MALGIRVQGTLRCIRTMCPSQEPPLTASLMNDQAVMALVFQFLAEQFFLGGRISAFGPQRSLVFALDFEGPRSGAQIRGRAGERRAQGTFVLVILMAAIGVRRIRSGVH
jgi:hypothetical protein